MQNRSITGNSTMSRYPYPEFEGKRGVGVGIVLSLITLGIYGLYWRGKQIATLNAWLKKKEHSFFAWFFLLIITAGIYGFYREYQMANSINTIQANNGLVTDASLPTSCMLGMLLGFGVLPLAIRQHQINRLYTEQISTEQASDA